VPVKDREPVKNAQQPALSREYILPGPGRERAMVERNALMPSLEPVE